MKKSPRPSKRLIIEKSQISPSKKQSCKQVSSQGFSELAQIVRKHPEVKQSLQNVVTHAIHPKSSLTPKASEKSLYFNNKSIRILKTNEKVSTHIDRNSCLSYSPRKRKDDNTFLEQQGEGIQQIQGIIKAENKRLSSQKVSFL